MEPLDQVEPVLEAVETPILDDAPVAKSSSPRRAPRPPKDPFPTLTERERDVALALASGITSKEVAVTMGISQKTIDTHRGHILKKLDIKNNVLLAHLAIREGWVKL